jgi:hypothetical protein
MSGDITFTIEEEYRKVGFRDQDDFTAKIYNLTESESQWLRGQIMILINERKHK